MMPSKIYLQANEMEDGEPCWEEVTWCDKQVYDDDTTYYHIDYVTNLTLLAFVIGLIFSLIILLLVFLLKTYIT